MGNQKWTLDLDWTGSAAYKAQKDRDWSVDGEVVGITRSANGLTFATVNAAGHMVSRVVCFSVLSETKLEKQVPYDKPKEALAMLHRWLSNKEL